MLSCANYVASDEECGVSVQVARKIREAVPAFRGV
jgi:hypothetical protein